MRGFPSDQQPVQDWSTLSILPQFYPLSSLTKLTVSTVPSVTNADYSFFFFGGVTMDGRCAVETCAEFGFAETSCTPRIRCGFGTDVLLCTGSDEAYVFSPQERKLKVNNSCAFSGGQST